MDAYATLMGGWYKDLRFAIGKTQGEVAKDLRMPQTHFSRIELGKSMMPTTRLKPLAKSLGVDVEYLRRGRDGS